MSITVNTKQAYESLVDCLKERLVPMLTGSPGIGKSAIVNAIAKEYNLKVIDIRLSQCDPTDLNGFPQIVNGKASYVPMDTFPLSSDEIPKGYDGWLLFLDEFNSAAMATQAAAYKITLDRMIGQEKLHDNCIVMCAGNLSTDAAIVNRLSTAMQSRLVHLELEPDYNAWLEWADENDIDVRITSYIRFRPDALHSFSPDHNDKTFACPRTWEFASRLIKSLPSIERSKLPVLAGTLSEGIAREFIAFTKVFRELPTMEDIVSRPESIPVPSEPSVQYALTGAISGFANDKNIDSLMKFIKRLPVEFQYLTVRAALRRNPTLMTTPVISEWTRVTASEF